MAKYISRYRLAASPFSAYVSVATFRVACKEYRRHRGLFSCAASHCVGLSTGKTFALNALSACLRGC